MYYFQLVFMFVCVFVTLACVGIYAEVLDTDLKSAHGVDLDSGIGHMGL